jgi:hypothetical protein
VQVRGRIEHKAGSQAEAAAIRKGWPAEMQDQEALPVLIAGELQSAQMLTAGISPAAALRAE